MSELKIGDSVRFVSAQSKTIWIIEGYGKILDKKCFLIRTRKGCSRKVLKSEISISKEKIKFDEIQFPYRIYNGRNKAIMSRFCDNCLSQEDFTKTFINLYINSETLQLHIGDGVQKNKFRISIFK